MKTLSRSTYELSGDIYHLRPFRSRLDVALPHPRRHRDGVILAYVGSKQSFTESGFKSEGMPLWHEDPKVIAKYLRNELSAKQVSESIKLLLDLGLVKRDDDGRLERVAEAFISTNNVPSPPIRSFHKQMLTKAIRAVDELTVHERFILGHTLPTHKSRLKEAQQLIFEFQRSLHNLMQSPDGDEVYQLAVQFFPLTDLQKYGPTISR